MEDAWVFVSVSIEQFSHDVFKDWISQLPVLAVGYTTLDKKI